MIVARNRCSDSGRRPVRGHLYATLASWGLHRMGRGYTKPADIRDMKSSLQWQAGPLSQPAWVRLEEVSEDQANDLAASTWEILQQLRAGIGSTRLVANSKALGASSPLMLQALPGNRHRLEQTCPAVTAAGQNPGADPIDTRPSRTAIPRETRTAALAWRAGVDVVGSAHAALPFRAMPCVIWRCGALARAFRRCPRRSGGSVNDLAMSTEWSMSAPRAIWYTAWSCPYIGSYRGLVATASTRRSSPAHCKDLTPS
jgi:hypothetical protein